MSDHETTLEEMFSKEQIEAMKKEDEWSMQNQLMLFVRTSDTHFFVVQLPHNHYWEGCQSVAIDLRCGHVKMEECSAKKVYALLAEDWLTEKTERGYAEETIDEAVTIYYDNENEEMREWWKFLNKEGKDD